MLISRAFLVPHLPTLMIDDHRGHRSGMVGAMREASGCLLAETPDVIVALSTRWETSGAFLVDSGRRHHTLTDYSGFGVEVRYDCPGHPALAKALVQAGVRAGLRASATTRGVDSGVAVPMHFLVPDRDLAVVPLSIVDQTREDCRRWGAVIRGTLAAWPDRAAFVVGGLLSFSRHAWTMRREVPEALDFDQRALEALRNGSWSLLAAGDERALSRIQPDARLRHLDVLRGFLGEDVRGDVRCYEASPGAGAALVTFEIPRGGQS